MTLYDSMVESYAPKSAAERIAVQQEVMQLIALAGLARGGFFEKAARALPFIHAVELEKALFSGSIDTALAHALPVVLYSLGAVVAAVLAFLGQMKKQ